MAQSKSNDFGPQYAVLSLSKLGLRYFRIFLKVGPLTKKKLVEIFAAHPNIGFIFTLMGWSNLAIGIWAKDNAEIEDLTFQIRKLLKPQDKVVYQGELTTLVSFGNRPVNSSQDMLQVLDPSHQTIELSPIENDLLRLLALDSSASDSYYAQILAIKPKEYIKLKASLEKRGVIVGYQKRINYLGYYFKVFLNSNSYRGKDIDDFFQKVWDDKQCVYFAKANGTYDLELELVLPSKSALKSYLKDFRDHKVVQITENLHTNLYPENKVVNISLIRDALLKQSGKRYDLRNSKLWYLNYQGAQAYLNIFDVKDYSASMETAETKLFPQLARYLKERFNVTAYHLIDLGSGNGQKGRELTQELGEEKIKAYYPLDISLVEIAAALQAHQNTPYSKFPVLLDFENIGVRFPFKSPLKELQVYALLGGTYGNYSSTIINAYLKPLVEDKASILVVAMPLTSTPAQALPSYVNKSLEDIAFGPLSQLGFVKSDFQKNASDKSLIIQGKIEEGCVRTYLVLHKTIKKLGRTFAKGTMFEMTTSWKPDLPMFLEALEKDFRVVKVFSNSEFALAVLDKK